MTQQLNYVETFFAPYSMLQRLTIEQIGLLVTGLAQAGYESLNQAKDTAANRLIALCGTADPFAINIERLRLYAPELAELAKAIHHANMMRGQVELFVPQHSVAKETYDRDEVAAEFEREVCEYRGALIEAELGHFRFDSPYYEDKTNGYTPSINDLEIAAKVLRGENLIFPKMLPPEEGLPATVEPHLEEQAPGKRPARAEAFAVNREKVLSAAIHVMAENVGQEPIWKNDRPIAAKIAAYLDEYAYKLFDEKEAPLSVGKMEKEIGKAIKNGLNKPKVDEK